MKSPNRQGSIALLGMALAVLGCLCGPLGQVQSNVNQARDSAATAQAVATDIGGFQEELATDIAPLGPTLVAGLEELGPTLAAAEVQEGHQWAISATATSERDSPSYAAVQAIGLPNTLACGDAPTAWASLNPNGQGEELTLIYAEAVFPAQINVHTSFNPGFVTQVRFVDVFGDTPVVYSSVAQFIPECPHVLTIDVAPGTVLAPTSTLVITLDQSAAPGWSQIDAVELVGVS